MNSFCFVCQSDSIPELSAIKPHLMQQLSVQLGIHQSFSHFQFVWYVITAFFSLFFDVDSLISSFTLNIPALLRVFPLTQVLLSKCLKKIVLQNLLFPFSQKMTSISIYLQLRFFTFYIHFFGILNSSYLQKWLN